MSNQTINPFNLPTAPKSTVSRKNIFQKNQTGSDLLREAYNNNLMTLPPSPPSEPYDQEETIGAALKNGNINRSNLQNQTQIKDEQPIKNPTVPQKNQSASYTPQWNIEDASECCTNITCTAINIGISIPLFPLTNLNLWTYATLCCIKSGTGIVGLHISKQDNEQSNKTHPHDCFNSIGKTTLMLLSLPEIALNKFLGHCMSMDFNCPDNRSDLSMSKIFRNTRIACTNEEH